ncbi:MBL fold metallo-hydrolase [Dyadobacter frigoris]|uniref:MBL fold metallo-hydrolase n=1 Tax=Dyadobacter frigoris TaxID=2576211 RepID=A0A4U6D4F9_9BACT|nr:MBL fold metallo-hydrolase [Dyadobacter frigoris]TKT92190.1 MBL fold metallo-hydrolase [Dyadobacter frigoris]GLU53355.1 MBL fold hydrolase [Dyadobacter frigoris]
MKIQQFEDKFLAHYSYAILSECESKVVLIDPGRNPEPYYDFAKEHQAEIIAVIETHSHADFVSSHLEIAQTTGAAVYASKKIEAAYKLTPFDQGDVLAFGKIVLKAINTPGHSDDSISVLLEHDGKPKYLFSGDTLFIGDCGRPDLRESGGNMDAQREKLAAKMYYSLRDKLMLLPDDVILYPAHGAGTLCGKALSDAASSTMGEQKAENWSLQPMSEEAFVKELTSDQPFIPAYFPFDVQLNKKGASGFVESTAKVKVSDSITGQLATGIWIVDSRSQQDFKKGHLAGSINIMDGTKFETWLGSVINPSEEFYLAAQDIETLERLIRRTASIGYETKIREAFVLKSGEQTMQPLDLEDFKENQDQYTIVDIRNTSEVSANKIFKSSIAIPLADLRSRINEIPLDKPIAVHCAGGYRSAIGSSLIASLIGEDKAVFDIGEHIKEFDQQLAVH